jgi:NADH:ubiquinone oxidoreductase subunit D
MTDEQLTQVFEIIRDKMKQMSERISVLEAEKATPQTSSYKEEVMSDEKAEFKSVEDAPAWNVYFKVNTSEGIYKTKVQQQAWTEKQSIYLGRTEQLFKHMSEKVKAKEIEAKWSILESVAEKIL